MKYYAQFYWLRTRDDGSTFYEEGIGDRQIIRLDGRLNYASMSFIAASECAKRGYDGYRLGRGERLDKLHWLTAAVQPVSKS